MQADSAVDLSLGIRQATASFDQAMAAGNYELAQAAGNEILDLCEQLCRTSPTTSQGASVRLRLAIDCLQWADPVEIRKIQRRLLRIERHLAAGRQRATDVNYLHSITNNWDKGIRMGLVPDVIEHIRAACAALKNRCSTFFGLAC